MVRELIVGAPNQYEGTVRARPETWDAGRWREAYGFGTRGEGFVSRTVKFIGRKFWNAANPMDGFAIADCEDSRAKRVLEFLIPILYPESRLRDLALGSGDQARGWSPEVQGDANRAISLPPVQGAGIAEQRGDGRLRNRPGLAQIRLHAGSGSGSRPGLSNEVRSDTKPFHQT